MVQRVRVSWPSMFDSAPPPVPPPAPLPSASFAVNVQLETVAGPTSLSKAPLSAKAGLLASLLVKREPVTVIVE
jgi:hypothetical protein